MAGSFDSLQVLSLPSADDKILIREYSTGIDKKISYSDLFKKVDTIAGSQSADGNLYLKSTEDSTKGKIYLGTNSAYNEATGMLGVGTVNPQRDLQIYSTYATIGHKTTIDDLGWSHYIDANGDFVIREYTSADWGTGSNRVYFKRGGGVGIGMVPTYQLELSTDSAGKPSTNTWTIVSDERVKKILNKYTKGLKEIVKINPVEYKYNGKAGFKNTEKINIGIIAQEELKNIPECINTYKVKLNKSDKHETELFNFDSHALTFMFINAFKEIDKRIKLLEGK